MTWSPKSQDRGNRVGGLSLQRTEHPEHDTAAMSSFVDFSEASFRAGANEARRPREEADLLGSVVYRPMVFPRNDVGWIAALRLEHSGEGQCHCHAKTGKTGARPGTDRPGCRFSCNAYPAALWGLVRRRDHHCYLRSLAQAVGRSLGLPFLQVFADRPCSGVSHPKEFVDWGNRDMRIGIVGSRRRTDRGTVEVCQRLGYVPAKIGSAFHSWDRTRAPTFIRRREPRSASQCEGRNQVEAEGCSAAIWIGSQRRSGWESGIAVLA
jgi:hypothetical protein